jgi:hypothetical protein
MPMRAWAMWARTLVWLDSIQPHKRAGGSSSESGGFAQGRRQMKRSGRDLWGDPRPLGIEPAPNPGKAILPRSN